jgi:hypothetical protein
MNIFLIVTPFNDIQSHTRVWCQEKKAEDTFGFFSSLRQMMQEKGEKWSSICIKKVFKEFQSGCGRGGGGGR